MGSTREKLTKHLEAVDSERNVLWREAAIIGNLHESGLL